MDNKVETLKQDMNTHLKLRIDSLNTKCKFIENNYQNEHLFNEIN